MPKTKKTPPSEEALSGVKAERQRVMRTLVSVLRGARQDADLTQGDMARLLGYTEDVVSNIEALRTPISFADAILWATRSDLHETDLFELYIFASRKRKPRKR